MTLKKMPPLNTDEEAEAFLENEDLSEYDWSGARRLYLNLRPQIEEVTIALPAEVASALKKRAEVLDLAFPQYLVQLLEHAVNQYSI